MTDGDLGLTEGGNPLQLRDVAALLRKGDDPNSVLKGLNAIEPLLDAAPDELGHYAGDLLLCPQILLKFSLL